MRAPPPTATSAASPTAPAASAGSVSTWWINLSRPSESSSDRPRFYGRRKGKPLKASRKGLIDELLPKLRIAVPQAEFDPRALFSPPVTSVRMEIGFGGGEHLAQQAAANPET